MRSGIASRLPAVLREHRGRACAGVMLAAVQIVGEVAFQAPYEGSGERCDDFVRGVPVKGRDPIGDAEWVLGVGDGPAAIVAFQWMCDADALAWAGEVRIGAEGDDFRPSFGVVEGLRDGAAVVGTGEVYGPDEDFGARFQGMRIGGFHAGSALGMRWVTGARVAHA